ncbi:MAG: hypothetical protein WCD49_14625 [Candidatus Acidiferrales bacterium]
MIIGCDFHTRYQQIAILDQTGAELTAQRLEQEERRSPSVLSRFLSLLNLTWPEEVRVLTCASIQRVILERASFSATRDLLLPCRSRNAVCVTQAVAVRVTNAVGATEASPARK